ncbi:Uncharacterized protein LW93_2944 [Fusarium fujikuroi]|nr:Uncharacterized protein LW93_2944 [Fusarium fujikuroi]
MPDNAHRITKKKDIQDVETYLRNANPKDFAPPAWATGSRWLYVHGEGRSTSKKTYHIGFKLQSNGRYINCLFIKLRGTQQKLIAEGRITEKDWVVDPPSPEEVLVFFKK